MVNRIDKKFAELKARGERALIAYLMAGDPSLQETETLVLAAERGGADIIELGVPFSDPIADGPIIQRAAERALRSGTSMRRILETVRSLRERTRIPIVLMSYYNSIHAFGEAEWCGQAAAAGVDGVIVPDLPPEEATVLAAAAAPAGPSLIFMLAPTSTAARRSMIAKRASGFLYYVSLTGITGAKLGAVDGIRQNVTRIRRLAAVPVAVGFGISTPDDVAKIAAFADGVVVGSAIVKQIDAHRDTPQLAERLESYIRGLKAATKGLPALAAS
ncbi:MAG TPA: tryptophan synthase subunit alpha [Nitrospirales bacterium]|nr:tryptophan synthase subunit alpha [Nitrospirales bacterium]